MLVASMSAFVSARIKTAHVGVNVCVNVFVSVPCPLLLLSPGEEPLLKALLPSKSP